MLHFPNIGIIGMAYFYSHIFDMLVLHEHCNPLTSPTLSTFMAHQLFPLFLLSYYPQPYLVK